jgi:hypothetical protein
MTNFCVVIPFFITDRIIYETRIGNNVKWSNALAKLSVCKTVISDHHLHVCLHGTPLPLETLSLKSDKGYCT